MADDGYSDGKRPLVPPHLLGILCVVCAVTIFSTQDMAIKWLSGGYPLHQIVFIRAAVAICVTLAVLVPLEDGYRSLLSKRWRLHMLRGFAIVVGNMCFFTGLASMGLAETVAVFFTAPLIITVLAARSRDHHPARGICVSVCGSAAPRRSFCLFVHADDDPQAGHGRESLGHGVLHPAHVFAGEFDILAYRRRWPLFGWRKSIHRILAAGVDMAAAGRFGDYVYGRVLQCIRWLYDLAGVSGVRGRAGRAV